MSGDFFRIDLQLLASLTAASALPLFSILGTSWT